MCCLGWDVMKETVPADATNQTYPLLLHRHPVMETADWAFYIQGDEVVHERYHDLIRNEMLRWKDNEQVDGLLFNYLHFYGSYEYVGNPVKWYPHEIRIIKNNPAIHSYRDAQGFRKGNNQKLNVKLIDAWIYHPQIPELLDLARAFPDLTIVLNHMAGPLGIGPYAGIRKQVFRQWSNHLAELADCENVFIKLGGLTMSMSGLGWHKREVPAS